MANDRHQFGDLHAERYNGGDWLRHSDQYAKRIAHDLNYRWQSASGVSRVETIPINESFAEALGLPAQEGLLVQTTTRGGPAAAAGIKGGDHVAQAGMRRFYTGGDVLTAIDG